MNKLKTDLELLRKSLEHWKENKAAETPREASTRWDDCALCGEYYLNDCEGCPIAEHTGCQGCDETGYHEADDAFCAWVDNPADEDYRYDWRLACGVMIRLLERLITKHENKLEK